MATKKTTKKTETKKVAPKSSSKNIAKTSVKAAEKSTEKTVVKVTKKPAKKVTPKTAILKTTASVTKIEPEKQEKQEKSQNTTSVQQVKIRRPYVILIIVIVILGALLYYFRGLFVAAVVNGQPISRLSVIQQSEKQSGKTTLDNLVRDALIEQEAKKENVTVSDKEVTDEITTLQNNLKKQGQTLDEVLSQQGMTESDLRDLIRLNKLVQKMVGKNIKVSDKEVSQYISQNKSSLPNTNEATLKNQVRAQLMQQKTNEAIQTWLANLQQKANIVYFVQY
jgi:parvulin-like peptidyl-prolyl isomerase